MGRSEVASRASSTSWFSVGSSNCVQNCDCASSGEEVAGSALWERAATGVSRVTALRPTAQPASNAELTTSSSTLKRLVPRPTYRERLTLDMVSLRCADLRRRGDGGLAGRRGAPLREAADENVEDRSQEEPEERDSQHA